MYLGSGAMHDARPPFSCFSSCKEALAVKSLSNYQTSFSNCIQAWLSLSLINDLELKPWAKVCLELEQTPFCKTTACYHLNFQIPNHFTYPPYILCNLFLPLFMKFSATFENHGPFLDVIHFSNMKLRSLDEKTNATIS